MSKFKQGDTVFSDRGQEAEYVAASGIRHIVRPVLYYEGEPEIDVPELGQPEVWSQVYASPPVEKYAAQVSELRSQIDTARAELNAIQSERRELERTSKDRLEKLKKIEQLALVEDFIDGKITHYVTESYGTIKIIPFTEAVSESESDRRRTKLRCLVLFCDASKNVEWMLSYYSDTSGSAEAVTPCTSHEQAMEVAAKIIDCIYNQWRAGKGCSLKSAAKSAIALGIAVPEDVAAHLRHREADRAKKAVMDAEIALEKAKAQYEEIAELAMA